MDSLREAVYLRAYGQKDPLVEYKNEAYEMFTELMGLIKNEALNNLFRSTSNLAAFEQFLARLPLHLLSGDQPGGTGTGAMSGTATATAGAAARRPAPQPSPGGEPGEITLDLPIRREMPKVGRNDPCPCGSGKKFKNCCGRMA
jgi:preprotein translocase subunit SecA